MRSKSRLFGAFGAIVTTLALPVFGADLGPAAVSPGASDRFTGVDSRCPTFSWQGAPNAAWYELVVYVLAADVDPSSSAGFDGAVEVIFARLPGGASSWTPSSESRLARGANHAWFVRALFDGDTDEFGEASDWSEGRFFRVVAAPTAAEVREALDVLTAHLENGDSVKTEVSATSARGSSALTADRTAASTPGVDGPDSPGTAIAAIRGETPDPSGETYGVVGISNSPSGAGVGAMNTGGGPDLVLDGSADGNADALFSEEGIDRPSPGPVTFSLTNSIAGTLNLSVQGQVSADSLAGAGSGLTEVNAETLDGIDSADFATDIEAAAMVTAHAASADHDVRYYTETELASSGGGGAVHWDNLTLVPAGLDDGDDDTTYTAGPGLVLIGSEFRSSVADSVLTPSANTLSVLDDTGTFETHLGMTIGSDGLGLLAYYDNQPSVLKIAHCHDIRCATTTVSTISGVGEVDMAGGVVVGSDGLGLIVYHDVSDDLAVEVGHCNDVDCSSLSASIVDALPGNVQSMPSIALGTDGYGLIAYFDGDPGDENLNVAHCENVACTSATVTALDTTGTVGWFPSVAVGSDGLGLIAYFDHSTNSLKVAHCDDVACTAATKNTLPIAGQYPSVTIGSDGLGLISFVEIPSHALMVAHCDNEACTTLGSIAIIDGSGHTVRWNSATIGTDGLGLIAYADFTSRELKVAHCRNVACNQATLVTVADVPVNVAVVIGVDGLPLIGWYQETAPFEGTINTLHCSSEFCVPYFRRR
jgi:hypothetical protein